MSKKRIFILLFLVLFSGCKDKSISKAPEIRCDDEIETIMGNKFNLFDYISYTGYLTVNGEVNERAEGDYNIRLVSEENGSMTVRTVVVHVKQNVAEEVKETPQLTEEVIVETPTSTIEPTPETTSTPAPTPVVTATPKPVATPTPYVTTPTPQPQEKVDESVGHGTEYFRESDYGDIFEAQNACFARLNQMPYGSCEPSGDETYYILNY